MRKFENRVLGVDQGSTVLFSDFEHDGVMWTGTGPREARQRVNFREPFKTVPAVNIGISMWDLDNKSGQRADISADRITEKGFEIVFKTWGDTRVARIRADWMAIGELPSDDDWTLY